MSIMLDRVSSALKICPQCGAECPANARFCEADGTALHSAREGEDLVGSILGDRYQVVEKLGEGGMGQVFLAEHLKLRRKIALKVMHQSMAADADAITRFHREAASASRIAHPNVAAIHDFGETADGIMYLAMEFVDGSPLSRVLQQCGALPPGRAAAIIRQAADALDAAHELHIIHRDLKPDNILLARTRDGGDLVKVVDFGLARSVGSDSREVTRSGFVVGTPAYMSPEQLSGAPVDARSDIYSLGLIAFALLTGRPPFVADGAEGSALARLVDEPSTLMAARPQVGWTADVQAVLTRALAREPARRYTTAGEFGRALDEAVAAMPESRAAGLDTQIIGPKSARRGRPGAAHSGPAGPGRRTMLIALVTIVAVGGSLFAFKRRVSPADPATADTAAPKSVGVLPFANLSDDKQSAYFSEGITQEIADVLGKLPGLRIASQDPRGAALPTDPRVVGKALDVGAVLEGTVQRAGERVRITARLVNVADGFQIWSDTYDRELSDVFAVQDDIARAVADGLKLTLLPRAKLRLAQSETRDPEAHALYLQGMYDFYGRTGPRLEQAIAEFRSAIARDSTYAAPYAGLALTYAVMVGYANVDVNRALQSAIAAGQEAISLDSTSADAYAGIAEARQNLWENVAALAAYRKALALDSNNVQAHDWYAEELSRLGDFDEALRQARIARQLEPLTPITGAILARIQLQAGNAAEAEATIRHTISLSPRWPSAHYLLSDVLVQRGRFEDAIAEEKLGLRYASALADTLTSTQLGYAYARAGDRTRASEIVEAIRQRASRQPPAYAELAGLLSALGREQEAVAALDTAVIRHDGSLSYDSRSPRFDMLRRNPRARALFATIEGQH